VELPLGQLREQRRQSRTPPELAPDTAEAIIDATERVLAIVPLHEMSVARILAEAGIGRKTFYSYFGSKFDAFAALLERVSAEFAEVFRPFVGGVGQDDPAQTIRTVLATSTELWRKHRAVGRATHEHWYSVPQIGEIWLTFVQRFSSGVAAEIDRQRRAGLAPQGLDSHQIASALLWTTEHLLYVAGSHADPNFPDEPDVLDTLVAIWTSTLYGTPGG
jgi:TetR/AcrR family transcriptional regulator, ethionamide resistance regulator